MSHRYTDEPDWEKIAEENDESEREADRMFSFLDYVYGEEDDSGAPVKDAREIHGAHVCTEAVRRGYIVKVGGCYVTTTEGRRVWGKLMSSGRY